MAEASRGAAVVTPRWRTGGRDSRGGRAVGAGRTAVVRAAPRAPTRRSAGVGIGGRPLASNSGSAASRPAGCAAPAGSPRQASHPDEVCGAVALEVGVVVSDGALGEHLGGDGGVGVG